MCQSSVDACVAGHAALWTAVRTLEFSQMKNHRKVLKEMMYLKGKSQNRNNLGCSCMHPERGDGGLS